MADSSEDDRKPSPVANPYERDQKRAAAAADAQDSDGSSLVVKPALKKKSTSGRKPKKALKWDEEAIEEHDLLRGTRMKIEEPNTPYIYYDSGAESDDSRRCKSPITQAKALSWDTLQNKLDSVAAVRDAYPSSPSSHGGDQSGGDTDAEEEKQKEMKRLEFKEHRKRHYNEMELVKKFRSEHSTLDDGGDADDEDE